MRIAILAAMPQETRPIRKLRPGWRTLSGEPFPTWLHQSPARDILLVETGMGNDPAERAARYVLTGARSGAPLDLILSTGFAGALSPDLVVGQVVLSCELAFYDCITGSCPVRYRCAGEADPTDFVMRHAVRLTRFITVERLQSKALLASLVPGIPAVTEMESTSIAAVAYEHEVPFMGLRAISDESTREFEWDLDSIVDERGRVRPARFMRAVLTQPRLAGSLPSLYRSSRIAGRSLAQTLTALLALPEKDLRKLIGPPQVELQH